MTEENLQEAQPNETPQPAETPEAAPSPLKKYLIFGGIGLAVIVLTVVLTLVLAGGGSDTETATADTSVETHETAEKSAEADHSEKVEKVAEKPSHEEAKPELLPDNSVIFDEDSLLDQYAPDTLDDDFMGKIEEELAFLDYQPEPEKNDEEQHMSEEDSLEAIKWFDQENERLTKWEEKLDAREKKLNALDNKVSKKLLKIEQAESTRISNLARLYDGMDSRAVANLMANLDDATVVSILPRMKQKNASAVLQLMPAQRAARLSKEMITIAEN